MGRKGEVEVRDRPQRRYARYAAKTSTGRSK
jgi:hypothetical protein